jgi:endonuclease YncB( thermonuclease family)
VEIIALLLIGLAAFVAFKIRKANDTGITQRHEKIDRTISPPVTTPFDPKSAKATVQETHLCGPAYVVDGDTIKIRQIQIRLFGIDAPEMNHPFGKKAKWALVSMCKGQTVIAEILESDDYGRTVAKCTFDDGRDLSAEMVKLGLAIDWPKFSNGQYKDLEVANVRKKLWLADARQKGRMHVWERFEADQKKTAK